MSCQPEDCSKAEQPTKPSSNADFPFLLRGLIHGAFAMTMSDSTVIVCGSLHKTCSSHEQSCCGDFPTDPQETASREATDPSSYGLERKGLQSPVFYLNTQLQAGTGTCMFHRLLMWENSSHSLCLCKVCFLAQPHSLSWF